MTTIRKTLTLTEKLDDFIKAQVADGRYTNDSEFVRDLLRREEEAHAKIEAIRAELIAAEASGMSEGFNMDEYLREKRGNA